METSQHLPAITRADEEQRIFNAGFFDRAIACFGVFYVTNGIETFLNGFGVPDAGITPIRYLLPAIIFVRLLARYKATFRVLQSDLFLCLFHVVVFASYTWSTQPGITLELLRSQYTQGVAIALFLATRFSLPQQVRLITVGLTFSGLASLFYVLAFPTVGIHQDVLHAGS